MGNTHWDQAVVIQSNQPGTSKKRNRDTDPEKFTVAKKLNPPARDILQDLGPKPISPLTEVRIVRGIELVHGTRTGRAGLRSQIHRRTGTAPCVWLMVSDRGFAVCLNGILRGKFNQPRSTCHTTGSPTRGTSTPDFRAFWNPSLSTGNSISNTARIRAVVGYNVQEGPGEIL